MSNPLDDEKAHFHVLVNSEGQHSLWPVFARVPAGWDIVLKDAARSACVEYIETNWTDMRPDSLKKAMKQDGEDKIHRLDCSLDATQEHDVFGLVRYVGDKVCKARDKLPEALTEEDGVEWKVDERGYRSAVTPLDKLASKMLCEGLRHITPDVPIISEEMSPEDQQRVLAEAQQKAKNEGKKGPTYWAIDPVDGTTALIANKDYYSVLVGLVEEGIPVFGVSYSPKRDEMFFTQAGRAMQSRQGAVTELHVAEPADSEHITLRIRGAAIEALRSRLQATRQPIPDIESPQTGGNNHPYGHMQVLQGQLDLHYMKAQYQEWDLAAYDAITRALGVRYVDESTGRGIIYGVDKNFRTPSYWLGHQTLLQRLGLSSS